MKKDRLFNRSSLSNIAIVVIKQHLNQLTLENTMDSQEQYEALLTKWGFVDTMAEDYARRQKRARRVKAVVAFFKSIVTSIKKINVRQQVLSQA